MAYFHPLLDRFEYPEHAAVAQRGAQRPCAISVAADNAREKFQQSQQVQTTRILVRNLAAPVPVGPIELDHQLQPIDEFKKLQFGAP